MSEDEFTKLYKYMQKEFDKVNKKLEEHDVRFDNVMSSIDGLTKLVTDYHQEMLMLAHKVDRLEQWILKVAEATGVKLAT